MIDISKLANLRTQVGLAIPCSGTLAAISASNRSDAQTSFAPPPPRHVDDRHFDLIAATLAGGMIAATGREHTAAEAFLVFQSMRKGLGYEADAPEKLSV